MERRGEDRVRLPIEEHRVDRALSRIHAHDGPDPHRRVDGRPEMELMGARGKCLRCHHSSDRLAGSLLDHYQPPACARRYVST